MTAVPHERPPPQPQSKALPTVQSSHPDIVATKVASSSRAPSRARITKSRQDVPSVDFTSRPATLSLIRRTLITDAPQNTEPRLSPKPIEGILPPLTSSNEIDLQLYAIVAIVVKDLVNTWYSKITQDHAFVDEVIQIIAHCSRALEQRIRHTDVAELLLDELPTVLERHVLAYRTATSSLAQQAYDVPPRTTYHSLNPHPALDSVKDINKANLVTSQPLNETAYRQLLVNGTLAILLPTEDLRNAPLRILVSDIIADLVLGQAVAERICEGWFIHDAINKAVITYKQRIEPKASGQELHHQTKTRLEKFGLLNTDHEAKSSLRKLDESSAAVWFWRITQWIYLLITTVWFVMQGIFQARHLPQRFRPPSPANGSLKYLQTSPMPGENDQSLRPVLAYGVSSLVSTLFRLHNRMPWLESTCIFWQHVLLAGSGRFAATNSVFDRFLNHALTTYVFTPNVVTSVLIGLRTAVFPNNSMGPSAPPPPSPEEQVAIRRQAAKAVLSLIPSIVANGYFNSNDEEHILRQIEEDVLDVFGDKYMNKHLMYGILELILVRLVPELSEAEVGELLAERGVGWGEADVEADGDIQSREVSKKKAEVIAGLE